MNDDALEQELRGWYRAEVDDSLAAPADLRDDVRAIPTSVPAHASRGVRRPTMLLIAAAITTTAIVGSAIVGSGMLRPERVSPPPSRAAVVAPTPSTVASEVPEPSATPTATPVLGGGLILAIRPHSSVHTCNTSAAPYDVVTIDPASGASTVLGTTSSECAVREFGPHWVADRTKILLLDRYGPRQLDLPNVTDAGRRLPPVCCDLPAYLTVWEGGGGGGQEWTVSPRGDRVAAVHTIEPGRGDGIVVSDIDGRNVRRLALPKGADGRGGLAWSPDESTIAISACRPCNGAERWYIYLVPVDGSAVRALVSTDAGETVSQPGWAPDGSAVAVVFTQCSAAGTPPQCPIERATSSLAVVNVASGAVHTIVSRTHFARGDEIQAPSWAPDGRRIRFALYELSRDRLASYVIDADGNNVAKVVDGGVRAWSPDGEWFLVRPDPGAESISIGSIDGGPLRELGSFEAVDW